MTAKLLKIGVIGLLISFFLIENSFAACSSYLNKVVFNEVYDPASGGTFLEIKVLDPAVIAATSSFAGWSIDLYKDIVSIKASADLKSVFTDIGKNTCGQNSAWIQIPDSELNNFIHGSTNGLHDFNFVLYETSGSTKNIVDILRMGVASSYYGAGTNYTSCTTIENALPSSKYDAAWGVFGNKDWFRNPDGTGIWGGQSTTNNYNTVCGSNNGGGAFALSKVASVTTVATNTNFNFTLTAQNGATGAALSSVKITDDLNAAGLTFVSCTTANGSCTNAAGVVTWNIGSVASNSTKTATLTVSAAAAGTKTNTITSNTTGSPSATATVTVTGASAPDHIRIEQDGSAITCVAESLLVKACANSDCSSPYTGGLSGNITAGGNSVPFSIASGSSQVNVSMHLPTDSALADPQTVRLGSSAVLPSPTGTADCKNTTTSTTNSTTACDASVSKSGFVFDVPNLTSGTASGNVSVSAVRSSDSSTCVSLFQNVTRSVAFWGNYQNPATGTLALQLNGSNIETTGSPAYSSTFSLAFNNSGVATLSSVKYSDVGLMQLNAHYVGSTANTPPDGGTIVTGTDTFVVKPADFVLSGIKQTAAPQLVNPAAADATGSKFVKAQEAFTVTVTAVNSVGAATPNYGKESTAEGVKLTSSLVAGLGQTHNPTLANNTAFGTFTNGIATGTTFSWDEAGVIKLTPGVGDADYLGAGEVAGTASGNVGRFYAAKFAMSSGTLTNRSDVCPDVPAVQPAGCASSFTYIGEAMTALFTLTAQSVGSSTLQNYNYSATAANNFAKLDPKAAVAAGTGGPLGLGGVNSSATRVPFLPCGVSPTAPCLTPSQATAGIFAAGVANVTLPFTPYRNTTTPAGPYAVLDIGIAPQDSDGAIMGAYDLDTVNVVAGVNNHTKIGRIEVRYGRLWQGNAYGSETRSLSVPYEMQYWNGQAFIKNTLDNATLLKVANFGIGNYKGALSAGNLPVSAITLGAFSAGSGSISLAAPNAAGSVDVVARLGSTLNMCPAWVPAYPAGAPFVASYLQGKWCGATYVKDPVVRATFGISGSSSKKGVIYLRESF